MIDYNDLEATQKRLRAALEEFYRTYAKEGETLHIEVKGASAYIVPHKCPMCGKP